MKQPTTKLPFRIYPEIININFKMSVVGFRKTKIKLFHLSHRRLLGEKSASRIITNPSLR